MMNREERERYCRRKFEQHHRRKGMFARVIGLLFKGGFVMLLWNLLVPELFGGPFIQFGQAVLLVVLGHLLTGGFGYARMKSRNRWRAHFESKMKEKFESKLQERMEHMSEEEKAKYKKGFTSGKWEVNIIEVEDEPEDKEEDGSEEEHS